MLLGSQRSVEIIVRALSSFPSILVFRGTLDFRKRRQSLAALNQSELGEDPFSATFFVFMNRRRDCVRALYWDKTASCRIFAVLRQSVSLSSP